MNEYRYMYMCMCIHTYMYVYVYMHMLVYVGRRGDRQEIGPVNNSTQ